jgi:hypothetical protein
MKCCLDFLGSLDINNLMTWLSFFKDSWSNITSDLRWLRPFRKHAIFKTKKNKKLVKCKRKQLLQNILITATCLRWNICNIPDANEIHFQ